MGSAASSLHSVENRKKMGRFEYVKNRIKANLKEVGYPPKVTKQRKKAIDTVGAASASIIIALNETENLLGESLVKATASTFITQISKVFQQNELSCCGFFIRADLVQSLGQKEPKFGLVAVEVRSPRHYGNMFLRNAFQEAFLEHGVECCEKVDSLAGTTSAISAVEDRIQSVNPRAEAPDSGLNLLAIPVVYDTDPTGSKRVLVVAVFASEQSFFKEDTAIACDVLQQTGGAFKRAIREEFQQMCLYHNSRMLALALDASELFSRKSKNFSHSFGQFQLLIEYSVPARICRIFIVDEQHHSLWHQNDDGSILAVPIDSTTILGNCVTRRETINYSNEASGTSGYNDDLHRTVAADVPFYGMIAIPIYREDQDVLGVLVVVDKLQHEQFHWAWNRETKRGSLSQSCQEIMKREIAYANCLGRARSNSVEPENVEADTVGRFQHTALAFPVKANEYKFSSHDEVFLLRAVNELSRMIEKHYIEVICSMQSSRSKKPNSVEVDDLLVLFNTKQQSHVTPKPIQLLRQKVREVTNKIRVTRGLSHFSAVAKKPQEWDFDVLNQDSEDLVLYAAQIFAQFNLVSEFDIDNSILLKYLRTVKDSYLPNPYHNWQHAFSVTQCSANVLRGGVLSYMQPLDVLGIIIAALSHDIAHPGTNNDFEIKTQSKLAIRYNDISVLENFHAATTFELLQQSEIDILCNLSPKARAYVRHVVIKAILATDISRHFKLLDALKSKCREASSGETDLKQTNLSTLHGTDRHRQSVLAIPPTKRNQGSRSSVPGRGSVGIPASWRMWEYSTCSTSEIFFKENAADRLMLTEFVIHSSDLNNPVLPFNLCKKWCELVIEEFNQQAETEEELGFKPQATMKVKATDLKGLASMQVTFIDFVVAPLWWALVDLFPDLNGRIHALCENRELWSKHIIDSEPEEEVEGKNTCLKPEGKEE